MKRETFIAILSAVLAEADEELLSEAEGLLFWRKRELRSLRVQGYSPGQGIEYVTADGQHGEGVIQKLNKYSVTVHKPHPTRGYLAIVVPVERIKTPPTYDLPF